MQWKQILRKSIIAIWTVSIPEEPLEPEEQQKLETRRQKQVAHSARIVYVLQQKVFVWQNHFNWSYGSDIISWIFPRWRRYRQI